MKTISIAVAALISNASALSQRADPDVFGPNGENFKSDSANYDNSLFGIDITKKDTNKAPNCKVGDWA
jgi:hypothetical protein